MPTIAEVAEIFMRAEGLTAVIWGDGALTTIGARAGVKATHPLGVMAAVLAALGRRQDRFQPVRISGHDRSGRPRVVRGFRLIGDS